jgi:hypothetical protein
MAPRARELCVLKPCVLLLTTFKLIPSNLQSNHSFVLQCSLFHSWQLNVLMRILTIFHLTSKFREDSHKGTSNGPSVLFVSPSLPPPLANHPPPLPSPTHKGQLGIASFPSLKVNNFQATLLLYFAPRV